MRKSKLMVPAGLVVVVAAALIATVGTAGTNKGHAGYKLFLLPLQRHHHLDV